MKTTILLTALFAFTTGGTSAHLTHMPRATQTMHITPRATEMTETAENDPRITTPDPWQCVVENVTKYFDVPRPTGALSDAIISYGISLLEPCISTATDRGCTITDNEVWCSFATAVPSSVLADYSSYGSAAASFWQANSESIADVSTRCPQWWARPSTGDHAWLNQTIAHGECYIAAPQNDSGSSVLSSTTGSASTDSASTPSGQTPTNSVLGRTQGVESLALASAGIIAAMNVVW